MEQNEEKTMKRLKKLESVTYNFTVSEFTDIIEKVYACLEFQASHLTRWSVEQRSSYITSVLIGTAPSKLIFADVDSCLNFAENNEFSIDVPYYKLHKNNGVKYLNIDSNNRVMAINSFLSGKLGLMHGFYSIGDWHGSIGGHNDTFDKMPNELKNKFLQSTLTAECYVNASREDLSYIFCMVNDGRPLNDAEKRNALTSDVARTVRKLSVEYFNFFYNSETRWFTEKNVIRRGIDDFIASFMFFFFKGFDENANAKNIWDSYQPGSFEDDNIFKFERTFRSFMKIVSSSPSIKAVPHRNSLFDLWIIYTEETKKGKKLQTEFADDFICDFQDIVGNILNKHELYSHHSWKDPKSFETMIGGRQPANNIVRYELITKELNISKYFLQLDSKRVVTDLDKFAIAVRDGWTTPEGKKIDRSKLNDGKTYHKGHKEPHSKGFSTTMENSVIQLASDNLKLGPRSMQDAFDNEHTDE